MYESTETQRTTNTTRFAPTQALLQEPRQIQERFGIGEELGENLPCRRPEKGKCLPLEQGILLDFFFRQQKT